MNRLIDFKSRFRILKGGKISLMVSALALGSLVNVAQAATDYTIIDGVTAKQNYSGYTEGSTITVLGDLNVTNIDGGFTANEAYSIDVTNNGSISNTYNNAYGFLLSYFLPGGNIINNGNIISTATETSSFGLNSSYGIWIDYSEITLFSLTNNANKNITATSNAGDASAIFASATNISNGTINNYGNLTAQSTSGYAYGINLNSFSGRAIKLFDTLNITNQSTGNITTTANLHGSVGIYLDSDIKNSTISNEGNITSTGAKSVGIEIYKNDGNYILDILDTNISNSGNITSTSATTNFGTNYAKGISILALEADANIDGLAITNTTTGNITINSQERASGIEVYADRGVSIINSNIRNAGLLDVTSTAGYAYGMKVDASGVLTLTNTTIQNDGDITLGAFYNAYGIYLKSQGASSLIKNTSTIDVTGDNAIGIGSYNMSDATATITNEGTINANGTTVAWAIEAGGTAGNIDNSGTINATKNNEFDKNAWAIATYSDAGISVNNSGTLNGNIRVAGAFTNSGTISLPYNATNATIGTFTNSETGMLEIGLLTDGTTTTYSKLSTTDGTFQNGSTINVNVLSSSTNVGLLAGTTLNDVVNATNALTINGTLNIIDNSALLDFNYVKDGNTVDLNAVQAQTIENAVNNSTSTNNSTSITKDEYLTQTNRGGGKTPTQNAAKAFDKVQNAGTYTAMNNVFTSLNRLSTNAQVAQAVESTTSQTGTANLNASTQISNNIQGIVDTRQNINMSGGLNSGDDMFTDKNFWMKAFGSIGEQDDKNGINGFNLRVKGFGLGVDGEKNNKQIGAALFYTNANVDVNNISQSSNLDVFTTLVYGNVPVFDDKTRLLYQASYSWQKNSSTRDISFMSTTATADYTTTIAAADLKLVRDYKITNNFMVQPLIQTTYRYFNSPSYSETGASALNLQVNSFNTDSLLSGGGFIAHYKIDDDSKIIGNINALYDVNNKKQTVTSSYEGAVGVEFDTAGIDNGRWQYETGIAYERNVTKGSNVNFGYNYQEQGSFDNHTLSAKYVYTF